MLHKLLVNSNILYRESDAFIQTQGHTVSTIEPKKKTLEILVEIQMYETMYRNLDQKFWTTMTSRGTPLVLFKWHVQSFLTVFSDISYNFPVIH